jgi:hypothetical protein
MDCKEGGHQKRSGLCGEEEYILPMAGIEHGLRGSPAGGLVAVSIELFQNHIKMDLG